MVCFICQKEIRRGVHRYVDFIDRDEKTIHIHLACFYKAFQAWSERGRKIERDTRA